MAESITNTYLFTHNNDAYSGATGTGAAILQGAVTHAVGAAERIRLVERIGPRKILAADTAKAFFPANIDIPASGRITAEIEVIYGSADVTAAARLVTWTVDGETIKTCEARASFGFDTSFVLASRGGVDPLYINVIYIVSA